MRSLYETDPAGFLCRTFDSHVKWQSCDKCDRQQTLHYQLGPGGVREWKTWALDEHEIQRELVTSPDYSKNEALCDSHWILRRQLTYQLQTLHGI